MTTTPEQLQAWRVKFESFYSDERECLLTRDANSGEYVNEAIDSAWMGYLRAKQETDQAMKLAKFGAYILEHTNGGHDFESEELWDTAEFYGLLNQELNAPDEDVEATIKELLK